MNYQKHYDALIERARHRDIEGYSEKHHILPKCLGGSDEPENLVKLTAAEHYIAHQLLVKLHPGNEKVLYAACLMAHSPTNTRVNNKLYSWLKNRLAKTQSYRFSGKTWTAEQNKSRSETVKKHWSDPVARAKKISAMAGKTWSPERRAAKSASMKGKPGRVWTQEQKDKLSLTKKRMHVTAQLLKGAE